ncbi:hypothetical protein P9112_011270 [Eukaryota sp. TZLM1-RC]
MICKNDQLAIENRTVISNFPPFHFYKKKDLLCEYMDSVLPNSVQDEVEHQMLPTKVYPSIFKPAESTGQQIRSSDRVSSSTEEKSHWIWPFLSGVALTLVLVYLTLVYLSPQLSPPDTDPAPEPGDSTDQNFGSLNITTNLIASLEHKWIPVDVMNTAYKVSALRNLIENVVTGQTIQMENVELEQSGTFTVTLDEGSEIKLYHIKFYLAHEVRMSFVDIIIKETYVESGTTLLSEYTNSQNHETVFLQNVTSTLDQTPHLLFGPFGDLKMNNVVLDMVQTSDEAYWVTRDFNSTLSIKLNEKTLDYVIQTRSIFHDY